MVWNLLYGSNIMLVRFFLTHSTWLILSINGLPLESPWWGMGTLIQYALIWSLSRNSRNSPWLSDLKRKIRTWTGIRSSDLRISSPALYRLNYPGSHASSFSNLSLETDGTLARRCGLDTICHLLATSELISSGLKSEGPSFESRFRFEFFSWNLIK